MAFLDEVGLAELWSLIKAEDRENATDHVKIATGSYTGTGTYGSNNKNSLTFDFVPKCLIISNYYSANQDSPGPVRAIFFDNFPIGSTSYYTKGAGQQDFVWFTAWGKTVSWYGMDAAGQLNGKPSAGYENQAVYRYFAIG